MKAVLGIDTSCYTTSCALADESGRLLASERSLLPVKQGQCGLRQSEAVFLHLKQLPQVISGAMAQTEAEIAAVCVSAKPVDGENSYMPVFEAGLSQARALAAALRVPCFLTTHQRGHLAAAQIGIEPLRGDFMALHLSGGTTDLLAVRGDRLVPIAATMDLPAGQLIDRVGVRLGLPFPSGIHLERLARQGKASGRYGVSLGADGPHLSGAEAQALRDIERGKLSPENLAAEVFDFIGRSVFRLLEREGRENNLASALLFGGVASSSLLRSLLAERAEKRESRLSIRFGKPEFSGDNAAGVAVIGTRKYARLKQEVRHGKDSGWEADG